MKKLLLIMSILTIVNSTAQVGRTVSLTYQDYQGKLIPNAHYTGVRVGEYYWMDNNFNIPTGDMPNTKEGIDLIHQRYVMFNFNKLFSATNNMTYWNYFEKKGMSQSDAMRDFNKYYGQYYPVRPAITTGIHYGKMRENGKLNENWALPENEDVLQLIGMAGDGIYAEETRQYLSFNETDAHAPAFAKIEALNYPFYYWFRSRGNPINNNKYKLNFVPAGWKYDRPIPSVQVTENYGKTAYFTAKYGDFIGLNQVLSIPTKRGVFDIHDYPEMKYQLMMQSFPVRFCRRLTDQELGYKLYISIEGNRNKIQYPKKEFYDNDWPGTSYPRYRTSEELLLDHVRSGKLKSTEIKIVKLNLNQKAPSGYYELDRGYLRGLYVQYILDLKTPKTVREIVEIAIQNKYLWLVRKSGKISLKVVDQNTQLPLKGGKYELKYGNGKFDIPTSYIMTLDELKLVELPVPNIYTITEIAPPVNYEKSSTPSVVIQFTVNEYGMQKNIVFNNKQKEKNTEKDEDNDNDNREITNIEEEDINDLFIGTNLINETLTVNSSIHIDKIEIYNIAGNKIFSDYKREEMKIISIKDFKIGVYIVYLKVGNKNITRKIIRS